MEVSDEGFAEFWSTYPKRQARKDALKAWRQLRPSAEVQQAILVALAWQIPSWSDLAYAPLPATYLRGERWTDEPLAVAGKIDTRLPAWAQTAIKARSR
tara:strand:- start:109 stop:405 length:297 start_codon:yes stop_codon:yes gene_type:complete